MNTDKFHFCDAL